MLNDKYYRNMPVYTDYLQVTGEVKEQIRLFNVLKRDCLFEKSIQKIISAISK